MCVMVHVIHPLISNLFLIKVAHMQIMIIIGIDVMTMNSESEMKLRNFLKSVSLSTLSSPFILNQPHVSLRQKPFTVTPGLTAHIIQPVEGEGGGVNLTRSQPPPINR